MSETDLAYADCTKRLWAILGDQVDRSRALFERANAEARQAQHAFRHARDAIAAAGGDRVPGLAELLARLDESADVLRLARLRSWARERRWKLDRKRLRLFQSARIRAKQAACFHCGGRPVLARVRIASPTLFPADSRCRSEHWICQPCAAKITAEVAARNSERCLPCPKSPERPKPRKRVSREPAAKSPGVRNLSTPSATEPPNTVKQTPSRPSTKRLKKT